MNSLYFNSDNEPDDFIIEFKKAISEVLEKDGIKYIDVSFHDREKYDEIMNYMSDFNKNDVKVFGTSNNKILITVENDNDSLDEDDSSDNNIVIDDGGDDV